MLSYNIQAINMLSSISNFEKTKERDIGKNKHMWVIEMNDARQPYLNTYYDIDNIDHTLKNCNIGDWCCKYWHSPANCSKEWDVSMSYDMHLE
eukprot:1894398-Ditylum_brightwellii.AAC.1